MYTSFGVGINHEHRLFLGTAFILLGSVLQILNSVSINQGGEIRRLASELEALKSKVNCAHVGAGAEVAGKVAVFKSLDGSVGRHYLSGHGSTP